ncbi:MAG TPA: PEP-CTERM sorting domain-containing protein [Rhodocyclaceae bacterium]|nr:PEP-CTERM sorting domain-containing protein [Rhodocyclaceae bacterium]
MSLFGIKTAYAANIHKTGGMGMSLQKGLRQTLLSALMLCASLHASASVMTFGTGAPVNSQGFVGSGMVITNGSFGDVRDYQGASIGVPGERELMINRNSSSYRFQLTNGGLFNLLSLDIEQPTAAYSNWATFGLLSVTGSNGASVNLSSDVFGTDSFGTTFSGISWFTLSNLPGQTFVDNIAFETPEPGTNVLVLAALGLMGVFAKRRKSV